MSTGTHIDTRPHVVVIGGGFQPLLYQVATASLSPGDIASPIRWVLRHQANLKVLLAEARVIDPAARRVTLDRGEISYDYLVIAAGATHAYFGHAEWARRAPGLKTLDDALEIRRQVLLAFEAAEREPNLKAQQRLLTFVIVGGGPTGVELAGSLAEIAQRTLKEDFRSIRTESARIVLVEGSPNILGTFPETLRDAARKSLEKLGVEVRTNCLVTAIEPEGVTWTSGGTIERLAAETVLWAAGVAASPLGTSLGVPLPGVAPVAKQEGTHAAMDIIRAQAGDTLQGFRYHNYGSMATIGRGTAVAEIGPINASGLTAWSYVTFQRSARLITGERLWPNS